MTYPVGNKDIFHSVYEAPEPKELSVEIDIEDLAEAIEYWQKHYKDPMWATYDVWNLIINRASNHKATLSELQRPYLKNWIAENKFLLCTEYSKRAIFTLNTLLEYL